MNNDDICAEGLGEDLQMYLTVLSLSITMSIENKNIYILVAIILQNCFFIIAPTLKFKTSATSKV